MGDSHTGAVAVMITSDIIIIGAGAAGLMTAISASEKSDRKIILLDSSPFPGKKILMSGGGRCNITNANLNFKNYFGESPNAVKKVILQFPPEKVIDFFNRQNVKTKIEKPWDKFFPVSDDAKSVLNALFAVVRQQKILQHYDEKVLSFQPTNEEKWQVETNRNKYLTKQLVLAFGGFSYPHTGSDGSLWKNLTTLGISIAEPHPALTSLKTADKITHQLSGLTHWCGFQILQNQNKIFSEENSLLFTHDGLSGPGILNVSQWFTADKPNTSCKLEISFIPEMNDEELSNTLTTEALKNPSHQIEKFLQSKLPNRLAVMLTSLSDCSGKTLNQLTKKDRQHIIRNTLHFSPTINGHFGYKKAEVTAGGIPFSEIDSKSMQLKRFPGLFAVGEVVNVHGIVGGYNFQWAWSSGWVCGKSLES